MINMEQIKSIRKDQSEMRCDSMNVELLNAYVQALRPERERYLYQHALNKVRVITRSMKPAEMEAPP